MVIEKHLDQWAAELLEIFASLPEVRLNDVLLPNDSPAVGKVLKDLISKKTATTRRAFAHSMSGLYHNTSSFLGRGAFDPDDGVLFGNVLVDKSRAPNVSMSRRMSNSRAASRGASH